jgi:cyanate permease
MTHAQESAWKLEIYMGVQSILILVSLVYAFILSKQDQVEKYVVEVTQLSSFKNGFIAVFKTNKNLMFIIIGFALVYCSFFLQLQKWVHISNQFNFTPVSTKPLIFLD